MTTDAERLTRLRKQRDNAPPRHDGDLALAPMLNFQWIEVDFLLKQLDKRDAERQGALSMRLTADDTIIVTYPDGQQIAIPGNEPGRILTILRSQRDREQPVDKLLAFQAAFTRDDVIVAGKQVRKNHEDRKEREKRARLKRIAQRDRLKQANELLAIVGL